MNLYAVVKDGKDLDDNPVTLYWDFLKQQFLIHNPKVASQFTFDRLTADRAHQVGCFIETWKMEWEKAE